MRALAIAGMLLASSFAHAETLVIDGGTVHPIDGAPFVGRVVVEDGVIVAAGPNATAPRGATTIDATGLHVWPGMCDAMSQLGLIEIGSVPATDDRGELGMYNPHLAATTALHPASRLIGVARANGITHTIVTPRSTGDNVIPGQAALVHLDGWTVEEMAPDGSTAMTVRWPAIQTRSFDFATFTFRESKFKEAEKEAGEKRDELRDWLDAARHYAKAMGSSRLERDRKLEALTAILDGKMPVIVAANSKRDIESAVEFAEEEGLKMILSGGRDAWKVKELLAEKGIPVVLGMVQSSPSQEDDPYDRPFRTAGELVEAGVTIALGTGAGRSGPHNSRQIPYEAAMAAAYGLSEEDAMRALTLNPAKIFGVDDQLGSIAAGKVANLIVTDGSPLEITTDVRHLIVRGREVSTQNYHRELYEHYRSRGKR